MALAIFDLDETLIAADSDHLWGQFVVEQGLVDATVHTQKNDEFYAQYKAGRLDIDEYLKFACSVLARYPMAELHQWRARFVDEKILPICLPAARELVESHRRQGDELLVITSTIEFVTRPIVELFNIETLIAPEPEISNGRYTGNMTGTPSFAAGKVTRLQEWLAETDRTMTGSYFYSDSHNDLPLLREVDYPVAVDPDPLLQAEAERNQWRVISLRT
ncbi:MAG: HAD-IB family hydrolase [Proteobacteria bacterium]|nr:HAD-IB family hydrolase [Pseudomonadota bacterium]